MPPFLSALAADRSASGVRARALQERERRAPPEREGRAPPSSKGADRRRTALERARAPPGALMGTPAPGQPEWLPEG
jgi:hypothetical protein